MFSESGIPDEEVAIARAFVELARCVKNRGGAVEVYPMFGRIEFKASSILSRETLKTIRRIAEDTQ